MRGARHSTEIANGGAWLHMECSICGTETAYGVCKVLEDDNILLHIQVPFSSIRTRSHT